MTPGPAAHPGYRFPAEVIRHAVWLYHLFGLSLRDVEPILAERGITVAHESVRRWCMKFGSEFAARLRRRRPRPGDTRHPDEVFLRIDGVLHHLWHAVDQHGVVLDILVQGRRNETATKRLFKRLLAGLKYSPKRMVTDGLRSYGVARREVLPEVRHRTSRYSNSRAENSHRPTRRRERQMQRFKPPGQAQRFLSAHAMIHGHFRPRRHLMTADQYRRARQGLPGLAAGDVHPNGGMNVSFVLAHGRTRPAPHQRDNTSSRACWHNMRAPGSSRRQRRLLQLGINTGGEARMVRHDA